MLEFDHLVVSCERLSDGQDYVEETLGRRPAAGGSHDFMGTHNALLSLGRGSYLEVIAIDPNGRKPEYPRWFGLDWFTGPPRLTNWVCRTKHLHSDLSRTALEGARTTEAARGDLTWQMVLTDEGQYPFDGVHPGLICWQAGGHPTDRMEDFGFRLLRLVLSHPESDALSETLSPFLTGIHASFVRGDPGLSATIDTPAGQKVLA